MTRVSKCRPFAAWLGVLMLVSGVLSPPGVASPAPDRAQIAQAVRTTLGRLPDQCKKPTQASLGPVERRDDYGEWRRLNFQSCGFLVQAWLAVPRGALTTTPVVVALHQTTNAGADEVMGLGGDANMAYGKRFYQAGFVVVAPDEFIILDNAHNHNSWSTDAFYRRFPNWSATGQMLHDHRALLDAITVLGRSPSCVAAVGHSLGGYNALMLAALDARIDVVVSSAGFEEMATDADALRWARKAGFVYIPSLAPSLGGPTPHSPPWDFGDVLSVIAPRPTLLVQGAHDENWTEPLSVAVLEPRLRPLYRNPHDLDVELFEGPHSFPAPFQELAIQFVEHECPSKTESSGPSAGR